MKSRGEMEAIYHIYGIFRVIIGMILGLGLSYLLHYILD